MDFYKQAEQAVKDAAKRQSWVNSYKQAQPLRSKAELNRMADMEMQFAKERKGVTGSKLKELLDAQRKYFFRELKRIEALEAAAKVEKDRVSSLREQQELAKKQFGLDSKAINDRENNRLAGFDNLDSKISGQADVLRARAEGSSLRGQNAFKGGSVEEFQFVSAMQRENEVQKTLSRIDEREEQRHAEIAALRRQAIEDATAERNELKSELSAKLDDIASAIQNKE